MDPKTLKGNPLLVPLLKPDLGAKLVRLVADDMARAKREKEEKRRKKAEGAETAGDQR